jgi:hypothetical protein
MTSIASRAREQFHGPRLQLVPINRHCSAAFSTHRASAPDEPSRALGDAAPALRPVQATQRAGASHVLVAGRDAAQRAVVLDELTQTMAPGTVFEEAAAIYQVLERAPASRLVVLSGDLDDFPAESLMQALAHRHPGLPVVSLDASAQLAS